MFDRTVTLYNFKKSDGKWYRTVFDKCTLTDTNSLSNTATGLQNGANLNIHFRCGKDKVMRNRGAKKTFYAPKEYQKLDNPFYAITFTEESDFIVIGETNEDAVPDDEYESGFYHYMNDNYDNVYMITNWAFYTLLPHFVVGGR